MSDATTRELLDEIVGLAALLDTSTNSVADEAEVRAKCEALLAIHDALAARVQRLTEGLKKYGQHPYACATHGTAKSLSGWGYPIVNPGPCDCGLAALLAEGDTPASGAI